MLGQFCGMAVVYLGPLVIQPRWQVTVGFSGDFAGFPGRRDLVVKLLHLGEKYFRMILILQ